MSFEFDLSLVYELVDTSELDVQRATPVPAPSHLLLRFSCFSLALFVSRRMNLEKLLLVIKPLPVDMASSFRKVRELDIKANGK